MSLSSKNKNTSVYGLFKNRTSSEEAFEVLTSHGFRSEDISVLRTDETTQRTFAHEKHSKAPEGGVSGAMLGALIGGTWGWLTGTGMMVTPGLGVFVAAGPFMSTAAGIGIGVCIGLALGSLIGLFFPEFEAKRYRSFSKKPGLLMSVHCDSFEWMKQAKALLKNCGASRIVCSQESRP